MTEEAIKTVVSMIRAYIPSVDPITHLQQGFVLSTQRGIKPIVIDRCSISSHFLTFSSSFLLFPRWSCPPRIGPGRRKGSSRSRICKCDH